MAEDRKDDTIGRAQKIIALHQQRIDRQKAIIEGQKKEILRLRDLVVSLGGNWREGL